MVKKKAKSLEARAFEAAVKAGGDGALATVLLSSGIVLKVRPVPPLAIRQAVMNVERPRVPIVFIEEKGREEENPDDPGYRDALVEYRIATGMAAMKALLVLGTQVESLPDGLSGPEDDGWLEELQDAGLDIEASSPRARYLAWLQFYALKTNEDLAAAMDGPRKASGITEEDVALAVQSFRGLS
jgi:hypothetical protein